MNWDEQVVPALRRRESMSVHSEPIAKWPVR